MGAFLGALLADLPKLNIMLMRAGLVAAVYVNASMKVGVGGSKLERLHLTYTANRHRNEVSYQGR